MRRALGLSVLLTLLLAAPAAAEHSPLRKHDARLVAMGCEHPFSPTTGWPSGVQWSQWNCFADDGHWYHDGDLVTTFDGSSTFPVAVLYHETWPAKRRVRSEGCKRVSPTVVDCKARTEWRIDRINGYKPKPDTYKCTVTWRVTLQNGPGDFRDPVTGDFITARDDIAYASNCAKEIPYPPTGLPVWPES